MSKTQRWQVFNKYFFIGELKNKPKDLAISCYMTWVGKNKTFVLFDLINDSICIETLNPYVNKPYPTQCVTFPIK